MKTFTLLLISAFSLAAAVPQKAAAQTGFYASVNFNTFYSQLSPYGRWLNLPRYGRVWTYREPGFRPYYTNGQWQYTDDGWYWNSGYAWGDIPFHYGRWELDPDYGWIWIPGYDYAPAWVAWSEADDCYGWAPLGFGVDFNVGIGRIPSNRWMYASIANINRPRIDRYCLPFDRNDMYYRRQQPIVNVYSQRNVRYMGGPRWNDRFGRSNRDDNRWDYDRRGNGRFQGDDRFGNRRERDDRFGDRRGNSGTWNQDRGDQRSRSDNYGGNMRRDGDNNIHFDPSTQYNRDRAIAGNPTPVNPGGQPAGPDRSRDVAPAPQTRGYDRPMPGRPMNRDFEQSPRPEPMAAPRPQMSQPRAYEPSQVPAQRSEAPRAMGGRERRIF